MGALSSKHASNLLVEREMKSLRLLLLEDSAADARLIQEFLDESGPPSVTVVHLTRLEDGLAALEKDSFNAVLLDLNLPDSQGLDTLEKVRARAQDVAVVVLTGMTDEIIARSAVSQGAQDYLVKGEIDAKLLKRSLRYAVERQCLLGKLAQTHLEIERERELRNLERYAQRSTTAITARSYGAQPLQEYVPQVFKELVSEYSRILESAVDAQVHKVRDGHSERLIEMANRLGLLRAGPRDVVDVHTRALRAKGTSGALPENAYVEEGRLMALELMGYLVSFYRNRSSG